MPELKLSIEEAFERAERECSQGNISLGKQIYAQLVQALPRDHFLRLKAQERLQFLEPQRLSHEQKQALVQLLKEEKAETTLAKAQNIAKTYPNDWFIHDFLGSVYMQLNRHEKALKCLDKAISLKSDNAGCYSNRGLILHDLARFEESLDSYDKALDIDPQNFDAHFNKSITLDILGRYEEALYHLSRSLEIQGDQSETLSMQLKLKTLIVDWSLYDEWAQVHEILGITTQATPFPFLALEDRPEKQLIRSQKHSQCFLPKEETPQYTHCQSSQKIRIGYFSADFHGHATMHLMAQLFDYHDQDVFEIYIYSFVSVEADYFTRDLQNTVTVFRDVSNMSDQDVAKLSRSDSIDIAVDLKGYTQNARTGIFACGAAPVQINYLGYPGTVGADFIDYIIADPVVIPEHLQQHYSEKVIYLPNSYQVNNNSRKISETKMIRDQFGLPEKSFVFCGFNNSYKITPREYDIWMRVMQKVDDSVLWLLRSNKTQALEDNLKREAENRGISGDRIILTDKLPHSEHLARHRLADLFIDTFNVNAHTTCSDALWAGLPVVTKVGEQFAARVAASLLHAVGLPELVTETEAEYEALILELATNRQRLAALKRKLHKNRLTKPLYDTEAYTRHLEDAYKQAHQIHQAGQSPRPIIVSA